jgi:hypothetical protein
VYLIDTESNEETKIKTELDVYDLKLNGNYMILSGENHNDFTYSIVAKDINTDEEIYISYTQNEQVVFDCYNDEVYFFEPTDASKLYKYNLSSGEKTKVSDLVQNNGKEKTYLCVNDAGIFFTKTTSTENEERSDLCKLSFGSDEIVTVEENINEIVGSALGALYCIDYDLPYTVYKIGLEDASKVELVSYKTIYNAGIQGNYLVCDGQNMMAPIGFRTYIVDLTGNEIIMDWTDEDEG